MKRRAFIAGLLATSALPAVGGQPFIPPMPAAPSIVVGFDAGLADADITSVVVARMSDAEYLRDAITILDAARRAGWRRWQRDRDKHAKWKAIERQEAALAQGGRKDWK